MTRRRLLAWLRAHPFAADAILAGFLLVMSLGSHFGPHFGDEPHTDSLPPNVLSTIMVVISAVPMAWRRRSPIIVLAIVSLAQFTIEVIDRDSAGWISLFIAIYTVAAHTSGRRRAVTMKVFAVATAAMLITGWVIDQLMIGEFISTVVFLVGAFVLGDNLQRRRAHVAETAERERQAARERELLATQRSQDERSRIARELHDVVAHSVSLMIIQAGAARRSMATAPDQAEAALLNLETTGLSAMDELRRVLGVLRTGVEGGDAREPQPSLSSVRSLVASDPTLPVTLTETGDPPSEVPSSVGLSLYRVVQEALTNVRKHAGHVRQVSVALTYEADRVTVQISDDGRGASVSANADGHGLIGMRERMALCGGTVVAGPRPGGGWHVRATAPLTEPNATARHAVRRDDVTQLSMQLSPTDANDATDAIDSTDSASAAVAAPTRSDDRPAVSTGPADA